MVVPVVFVMRMIMPVVVAMASGGIMRVIVAIAFGGGMVMTIALGVGASTFHFLMGIGGGLFGLAAGEKQGGKGYRCDHAFHWSLVFVGLLVVVLSFVPVSCLMRFFHRTYHARWCRLMRK